MTNLRSNLIRLAYENPSLRSRLLPILSDRVAKGEFEEQFQKANKLDAVDPTVAKLIVESGMEDGAPPYDDKISVKKTSIDATALRPSQTTMVLEQALQMALSMLKSGQIGGDLAAMISADNYILDGHHRWAATILAGGGKVGGFKASVKGPILLRVLNILSKGAFNVRNGKTGTGDISTFTPANVRSLLSDYVSNGYGGDFPLKAEEVQEVLARNFGSVEDGIEAMANNVEMMEKNVPSWAPDRKQMPVIEKKNVPAAVGMMNAGVVDWNAPYKEASLRSGLIRLAHARPALRPHLLPLLTR